MLLNRYREVAVLTNILGDCSYNKKLGGCNYNKHTGRLQLQTITNKRMLLNIYREVPVPSNILGDCSFNKHIGRSQLQQTYWEVAVTNSYIPVYSMRGCCSTDIRRLQLKQTHWEVAVTNNRWEDVAQQGGCSYNKHNGRFAVIQATRDERYCSKDIGRLQLQPAADIERH